ncbi:MAG: tetratricopeptide repeat protein, partial [bacterium]
INSEHPEAAYRIGLYYLHNHQFEQAVRYLQKAVQINSNNPAVHFALGTALQQFSMTGAAQRAYKKAIDLDPKVRKYISKSPIKTTPTETGAPFSFDKEDIQYFLRLFSGREGVFARQWVGDDGKAGYMPVYRPLIESDIEAHFKGNQTLGYYLMRSDNTVTQLVFDMDITKQVRNDVLSNENDIRDWKHLIWSDVLKIQQALKDLGIQAYPEDSGFKGMHLWIFFSNPQPARDVLIFTRKILSVAGPPPAGIHREIFPRESRVMPKALGSMIKLPLGIHKVTNRRCLFLDSAGTPVTDQLGFIRNINTTSDNTFRSALERLKSSPDAQLKKEPKADRTQVNKIIKGCNVLRYLIEKAEKERMLAHIDRLTILGILVHLGKAGQQTMHEIIGNTLNYSFRITERWIQRKKGFPISCPKIREWQSHITPSIGCFCKFPELTNSYPSPVLHADQEFI